MKVISAKNHPHSRSLADTLPHASDFVREVTEAAVASPEGSLHWPDINRLAARWLRPSGREGHSNSSQLGHAIVIELVAQGVLDADMTTTGDGKPMAARVFVHPLPGSCASRHLAA